jgi:predicted outer membrane repeat protein
MGVNTTGNISFSTFQGNRVNTSGGGIYLNAAVQILNGTL